MKIKADQLFVALTALLSCLLLFAAAPDTFGQGTAFTYQGRLTATGSRTTGLYDFVFALYNDPQIGSQVGIALTNSAVGVTNSYFATTLDFGSAPWTGQSLWLQLLVCTNGDGNYVPLTSRQQVLPVPYAITAGNLSGTLASTQLAGTYSGALTLNNAANQFTGIYTGDGSSLTNLNAAQFTGGAVPDARLSTNVPLLNSANNFTGTNNFTGSFSVNITTNNDTGNGTSYIKVASYGPQNNIWYDNTSSTPYAGGAYYDNVHISGWNLGPGGGSLGGLPASGESWEDAFVEGDGMHTEHHWFALGTGSANQQYRVMTSQINQTNPVQHASIQWQYNDFEIGNNLTNKNYYNFWGTGSNIFIGDGLEPQNFQPNCQVTLPTGLGGATIITNGALAFGVGGGYAACRVIATNNPTLGGNILAVENGLSVPEIFFRPLGATSEAYSINGNSINVPSTVTYYLYSDQFEITPASISSGNTSQLRIDGDGAGNHRLRIGVENQNGFNMGNSSLGDAFFATRGGSAMRFGFDDGNTTAFRFIPTGIEPETPDTISIGAANELAAVRAQTVAASSGFSAAGSTGLTTNINVIVAGGQTNQLQFQGGILTGVVPQ